VSPRRKPGPIDTGLWNMGPRLSPGDSRDCTSESVLFPFRTQSAQEEEGNNADECRAGRDARGMGMSGLRATAREPLSAFIGVYLRFHISCSVASVPSVVNLLTSRNMSQVSGENASEPGTPPPADRRHPRRLPPTRLPDKPLADIHGEPMIVHVWRRAVEAAIGPVLWPAARRPLSRPSGRWAARPC